jgi:hypothetical protein
MKTVDKNTKAVEKLSNIKVDLDVAFIALIGLFRKEYSSVDSVAGYIHVDLINAKLNALKALEYHFRDHVVRVKSKYPKELKDALRLLNKYSENITESPYSDLVLKEKFDGTGTMKSRNKFKKKTSEINIRNMPGS